MPNERHTQERGRRGAGAPPGHGLNAMAIKGDVLSADPAKIDTRAEELAESIVRAGLATSQVRNFYGAIAKLRAEGELSKQLRQLAMHRSRLAYLTARADGKANALWDVFGPLLKDAKDDEQVNALCDFAEAVVAYHKYYEWQKKKSDRGGSHGRGE